MQVLDVAAGPLCLNLIAAVIKAGLLVAGFGDVRVGSTHACLCLDLIATVTAAGDRHLFVICRFWELKDSKHMPYFAETLLLQ